MNVQKMIFPGLLVGILSLIGIAGWLVASPTRVSSAAPPARARASTGSASLLSECSLSPSYPDSILQWCGLIDQYARENSVDSNLVSAVMLQESAGRPDAYSKSGAVGLMQVMPRDGKAAAFICKNGPCFSSRPSMSDLFDPEYNVAYGVRMLASLIREKGELREALRAYGPVDVGYSYADLVLDIMRDHQ